jgi:hypothetical protein
MPQPPCLLAALPLCCSKKIGKPRLHSLSLECVRGPSKDYVTTLLNGGVPIRHTVLWEVIQLVTATTAHKTIPGPPWVTSPWARQKPGAVCKVPGALAVHSVLQSTQSPDEDLSLVVSETYGDTPSVERPNGQPPEHYTSGAPFLVFFPVKP